MRKFLLILLILFSQASYSQKIEERKWDKFDSIYSISTKEETLVGKKFGKNFFNEKIFYSWYKKPNS